MLQLSSERVPSAHRDRIEPAFAGIIHVQVQPPDDLFRHDAGFHQEDFVGEVRRCLVEAEFLEGIVRPVSASGFDHDGGCALIHGDLA